MWISWDPIEKKTIEVGKQEDVTNISVVRGKKEKV